MNTAPILSELVDEEPELQPLIERFVSRLPAHIESLRTHRANGAWEELREAAHDLKGTAGNMGFPALMELAHAIETRAANQSTDELDILLRDIADVSARISPRAS